MIAILGILAGAIGCYILNRKRKGELEALSKEKDDLFAKLTKAEQDKVDSETQLNDARTEISGLTGELNDARTEIRSLTGELNDARTEISGLTGELNDARTEISGLTGELNDARTEIRSLTGELNDARTEISGLTGELNDARTEIRSLTGELNDARTEISGLTGELNDARTEISGLTGELNDARTEIRSLTGELNDARTEISGLTGELNDARTEISGLTEQVNVASKQIEGLTIQLIEVSESNENALKLLYLFEVSLQLSVFVIYSEVSRVAYLAEAYKELYKEYKEFLEEVDKRTKRRLVRTGIGAVMSLIPGVGILQLGADLAELADFAETVVDGTAELDDVMQAVNSSLNILNSLGEFINLSEIGALQSEISSDEDREKVMQEYQGVFEEVFRQDQGWGPKEPNASDFDNFLKTLIQRMKMFVDSMPERERRKALDRIVGNFGRFGIRFHT